MKNIAKFMVAAAILSAWYGGYQFGQVQIWKACRQVFNEGMDEFSKRRAK